MWLLIPGTYLAVAVWTWRRFAVRYMEQIARSGLAVQESRARSYRPQDRESFIADQAAELVPDYERDYALSVGIMAGLFWPPYWVGRALLAVVRPDKWQPPTVLAAEQRRELAELRQLAREHGLPMPDQDGAR